MVSNFRGITLGSFVVMVYARMLARRLSQFAENRIPVGAHKDSGAKSGA